MQTRHVDWYDDLSDEEVQLDCIGLTKEKVNYIASILLDQNPELDNRKAYAAAGKALKAFSFRSVVLAAKNVQNLDNQYVYARLSFYAKSYYATEHSADQIEGLSEKLERKQESDKLLKMLKNPKDSLMDLLMFGSITKEQYDEAVCSEDKSKELIKEVMRGG